MELLGVPLEALTNLGTVGILAMVVLFLSRAWNSNAEREKKYAESLSTSINQSGEAAKRQEASDARFYDVLKRNETISNETVKALQAATDTLQRANDLHLQGFASVINGLERLDKAIGIVNDAVKEGNNKNVDAISELNQGLKSLKETVAQLATQEQFAAFQSGQVAMHEHTKKIIGELAIKIQSLIFISEVKKELPDETVTSSNQLVIAVSVPGSSTDGNTHANVGTDTISNT